MCGITGYIGYREAYPIIINGLKRLEYRGYDSAGIMLFDGEQINLSKTKGKVVSLEEKVNVEISNKGFIGVGHTRWATHGIPNDVNSHPHTSQSGNLVIVHNGIIENYDTIKQELISRGYQFHSDTDTEVLINLIEEIKTTEGVKLGKAVQIALNQVIGAYAIAVFDKAKPDEIVVAKLGSPIAIGVGKDFEEFFIASDASPFIEYTKEAIYLEDEEMAIIKKGREVKVRKIKDDSLIDPNIQQLKMNLEQIEKGGYDHFMLKEIHEQPDAITDTLRGRLLVDEAIIKLSGLENNMKRFLNAERIIIIACGTSWHAGLVGEYIFEDFARIPVEVEYASEFRYRNPVISERDVVIAISQSGETADTLAAIKLARSKGAFVFGICNVVGSSISRENDTGAYTHAGPEIGVASTKAFTTQITVLLMMALRLARAKGTMSSADYRMNLRELELIPGKVEQLLNIDNDVREIAKEYMLSTNCLYLGRGYNFPVALEGALKLKEISYNHAEGYPAGELKHGPLALVDDKMPVIAVCPNDALLEKLKSNIEEVRARGGELFVFVDHKGDHGLDEEDTHLIELEASGEFTSPIVFNVPLQLLSYHVALLRGTDVDQPRNLAKSVTVE